MIPFRCSTLATAGWLIDAVRAHLWTRRVLLMRTACGANCRLSLSLQAPSSVVNEILHGPAKVNPALAARIDDPFAVPGAVAMGVRPSTEPDEKTIARARCCS